MSKEIWGPPLWRLLHTLAERLGAQTIPLLATDEKRAWVNFLRAVRHCMPCMTCRTHFRDWCLRNPLERFMTSYVLKDDSREWLWALHEEINRERGVAGPALADLPVLYGGRTSTDINGDYKAVMDTFRDAVQQRKMNSDAFMDFKMRFATLRAITS